MYPQAAWLRVCRATVALALTAALIGPPVAASVLHRAQVFEHPVLEGHHHAGTCVPWHDHTICTMFGSHRVATQARPVRQFPAACHGLSGVWSHAVAAGVSDYESLRPRAPPLS